MSEQPRLIEDDEIDLLELFKTLWDGKWWITLFTTAAAAIGVAVALALPNKYEVTAKIAPVEAGGAGGLSALAGQFGGLASLAGISLPSGGGSESELLLEIMQSRAFVREFIAEHNLTPRLMAVASYDPMTGVETFDTELYNPDTQTWVRVVEPPKQPAPSVEEQVDAFLEVFKVNQGKGDSVIGLSFTHPSPRFGAEVIDLLIARLDDYARERDQAKAEQSIEYLEGKLRETRLTEVQRVLYDMIESQTKTLMLAEVNQDYAFQVIDPPYIPEKRSSPKRALIAALAVVLGGMVGVLFVLIRSFVRNRKGS